MRIAAIIVVLVLVLVAAVLVFSPKPPKDVQSLQVEDNGTNKKEDDKRDEIKKSETVGKVELTEFSFVGYGPGKSHTGVFEKFEVKDVNVSESGIPTRGTLIIDTDSVKTDTALLDQHLKEKAEFFDVDKYPTIEFSLSNITELSTGLYEVRGNLSMKDILRPVTFTVNGNTDKTFSSEFKLNMTDFGFVSPGIVNDEVLIKFAGKVH